MKTGIPNRLSYFFIFNNSNVFFVIFIINGKKNQEPYDFHVTGINIKCF
jgi:hypothetical protein